MSLSTLQVSIPVETLSLLLMAAGLGLSILEAFAPGAHFIVVGISLLGAGLFGFGFGIASPLILGAMVLLFGVIALVGYHEVNLYGGESVEQTRDSDSLRGRTGEVTEQVTESSGEVKIENGGLNPYYRARTIDGEIAEGSEVIIVDPGGGNVVTVESTTGGIDEIDRALGRYQTKADSDSNPPSEVDLETESDTDIS
ncbi:MAG: membrane protein implicated in regulation of membrane protease activity [Haloquadratum sp. J07HQX50]|jgi:Membrane protein implicated in regulation of membrane protease activity|nr:MAG: membrane protein implicated in regulation of membrane protease activity [Haloquadratum sp. J07HQX50]